MNIIEYLTDVHGYKISSDPRTYSSGVFGLRNYTQRDPKTGKLINHDSYCGGEHNAVDLYKADGSPVPAVFDGLVVSGTKTKEEGGNFGGTVVIADHEGDYQVIAGHLKDIQVKVGDYVKQGDIIGYQSNTNYAGVYMDSHLHMQMQHQKYYASERDFVCVGIDPFKVDIDKYVSKGDKPVSKIHLLVNGHGAGDSGAVGNGTNERDFTRDIITPRVAKYINATKGHKAEVYDKRRNMFADTVDGGGMRTIVPSYYASVTEWHLDAFNGEARGGHVIIAEGLEADGIDKGIANAINRFVGIRFGGINHRDNLLQVNVAKQRGINYRLVELGFIDNAQDMKLIRDNIDGYCKALAKAITGANATTIPANVKPKPVKKPAEYKPSKPAPKPVSKPQKPANAYEVNAHGTLWKKEVAQFVNGNQRIEMRHDSPFTSATSAGFLAPFEKFDYDEVALQDNHVWIHKRFANGNDVWLPIRTWNKWTGATGSAWGVLQARVNSRP